MNPGTRALVFGYGLLIATAAAGQSSVMRGGLAVSIGECEALRCSTREGMQQGLTTVETEGSAPKYAGTSLLLKVVDYASKQPVVEHKVGVMSDGRYTTSIAAYNLEAGRYAFGFSPAREPGNFIAFGSFSVSRTQAQAGLREAPPSDDVAGSWYGVGGTVGTINLKSDGTYEYGGNTGGRYRVSGNQITFSGTLAAWNGGKATLNNGNLEFYWKNANGGTNYFAFSR